MTRKELYNAITSLNLQDEVKARFGKNYTQVSNVDLENVVAEAEAVLNANAIPVTCNAIYKLVEILAKKHVLLKSEVDAILNA